MTDPPHRGPGDVPGVDVFAFLAAGFLPTHSPRPTDTPLAPAVQAAVDRCCKATESDDLIAQQAQTPIETEPVRIRPTSRSAAGLPAIASSFRTALEKMGARKTLRTFRSVNQKKGFDCQSCAWPSPDGKRHRFEFCESGAKAMADEGIRRVIGPDFFATWSIDALAAQSDHWLNAQGRLATPMFRREGYTHYEPIGWDRAFEVIGQELRSLE